MKADAVIVGAGIAGSALAYYLSSEGLRVILLDKDYPGLGASGRSAGLMTVQHWNRLDITLSKASQEICQQLAPDGRDVLRRVGFLRATSEEEDIVLMEERVRNYRKEDLQADLLEGEALSARFPAIDAADLLAGIFTPQDGYVDAYDVTSAFVSKARERGAVLTTRARAEGVSVASSRVVGVESAGNTITSEAVIIAAGAWSSGLLRGTGVDIPLKPYRTQALVTAPVKDPPDLPMFHELPPGLYFRPDQDGLLLGDGTEHEEADPRSYDTHADFELYSEIAAWISRRVPALKDASIARGWSGLCVATPDRLPVVGEVEEVEGLFVLGGFNGLGIMRAPPLARSLAEALLGHKPSLDLAPFYPGRFEGKADFPIREGFTLQ